MKLTLPSSVTSPQDVDDLVLEVREYARWFAHNEVKRRAGAEPAEAPAISPAAKQVIRDWHGDKSVTDKRLDKLVRSLEDFKTDAPLMTITLAAPPSGDIRNTLITWCRQNIAENVLVNFRFNRTILGGLVVRFGSHIYDWSFRRAILDNRERFPEVLRNV